MIRNLCICLASAFILTGCGGKSATSADEVAPAASIPKDISTLPDPFETLFPWDTTNKDIITTPSGLQYIVVNSGDASGPQPSLNDSATVHYDGRLAGDGTKFDSSIERGSPATFGVGQVIPGWTEALQLMRPGDEWMVYLPSDIAYGEQGTPGGPIGPNEDLVFRVNLIETIKDTTPGAEIFDANTPWDPAAADVVTTASGLQYKIISSGDESGTPPTLDSKVEFNAELRQASDNRRLQSTWAEGSTQSAPVNRLFPGWSEAMQLMRPGDDWLLFIPAGPLGIEQDIMMRTELVNVKVPQISNAAAWEKYTPWNSDAENVQKTESGLEYIVLEAGDAAGASPTRANQVEVYYEGRLTTGETFDSAYARGESIEFGVTGVIPGWTEALQLMRPGDRWLVYLPSNIAYGQTPRPGGLIKPGDDLIFEMQLMNVR